ncbi:MAG: orotidine-5'-phosphate decarboxylase [Actinobacteria bacterium]|jgi:orotidine-5'-phosphate decarboxylase|uniref:Orotidine 5'-phosphate decarboxylase n=1 Tax=freshwater metagenome TaxID=449393 RepID=A0A6J6YQX6_9ZZZZ|nr:orotidine-5'-phosphate decarboxylase [Actinomycetota bacterium]MTA49587.1 orotidine-5'-phosphate decarboxylase [Actinomycetota bacterium]MTA90934.1 orotidine-5'-phosphate decarboxylase [Actinomycetota bacterium]
MKAPIILAVDTSDFDTALAWIENTKDSIAVYKLGLEFYLNFGSAGVSRIIKETGAEIFLDLKLHDIPHTVAGAANAISHLSPKFLTVHASGGRAMVKAAADAVPKVSVTAVTILTSLSEEDLFEIGYASPALESAVALAKMAVDAGAKALVCSPLETAAIRSAVGTEPIIITPGVRPLSEVGSDDQKRTMTPKDAIAQGANFVVIGRPITSAWVNGADAIRDKAALIASEILGN